MRLSLLRLTKKVQTDYRNLKEFTENASHEIQTPLAVIRSEIEELINKDNLTRGEADSMHKILLAANRLSKINQQLLLLTRIENRQFNDVQLVDLAEVIDTEISWLQEMLQARNLRIDLDLSGAGALRMSRSLAGLMVKNLLENAIRYTEEGQSIQIVGQSDRLSFGNPGLMALPEPEKLFERFHSRGPSASLGLGLAIVAKIAEIHAFELSYTFYQGQHWFTLVFPD